MLSSRLQRHDPTAEVRESVESFIALSDEETLTDMSLNRAAETRLFCSYFVLIGL